MKKLVVIYSLIFQLVDATSCDGSLVDTGYVHPSPQAYSTTSYSFSMIGDKYTDNSAVTGCTVSCQIYKYGNCGVGQGQSPTGVFWGNGNPQIPLNNPAGKNWGFSSKCTATHATKTDAVWCHNINFVQDHTCDFAFSPQATTGVGLVYDAVTPTHKFINTPTDVLGTNSVATKCLL